MVEVDGVDLNEEAHVDFHGVLDLTEWINMMENMKRSMSTDSEEQQRSGGVEFLLNVYFSVLRV